MTSNHLISACNNIDINNSQVEISKKKKHLNFFCLTKPPYVRNKNK